MKIIFTITDAETLREYDDVHPDIIIDDFINNFEGWLKHGDFEVGK